MRSLLAALAFALFLQPGPAAAAIRIIDSNYENGQATITGQTRPHQKVTLGGQFTTTSDGGGHFEFHVKYKPSTCLADITAGEDSYSALLTGCLSSDAATAAARIGVSPPPADAK
jgi:hypothetical protein